MGSNDSAANAYPTVLVAVDDAEARRTLVDGLRQDDYNILEAPDLATMVEGVLTHATPIHLLLVDAGTEKLQWATRLKNHRQRMTVFVVAVHQQELDRDVLTPERALAAVQGFFRNREAKRTQT
jgi:DNA-binding response OmpR family regulator